MAADSKSNRRSTGGRNDDSDNRKRSGGRSSSGARKSAASRKSAAGGRKTAAKKTQGRARKSAAKKASGAAGGRKSAAKKASARKAPARRTRMDALSLLKEDHERVDQMFRKYERMKEGDERKDALREQILEEVRVHAQVEEEVFYPALRTALEEQGKQDKTDLLDEADVEHATVKWLMAELEGGKLESAMVDARMKVMSEYIKHHVEEEEGEIFRAAKRSDVDLEELGRQLDARKRELKGEPPLAAEGEEEGLAGAMAAMQGGDSAGRRASPPTTH